MNAEDDLDDVLLPLAEKIAEGTTVDPDEEHERALDALKGPGRSAAAGQSPASERGAGLRRRSQAGSRRAVDGSRRSAGVCPT